MVSARVSFHDETQLAPSVWKTIGDDQIGWHSEIKHHKCGVSRNGSYKQYHHFKVGLIKERLGTYSL